MNYTAEQIAARLDLAVLKPTATRNDVKCACALANKHGIKSVCVAPIYVPLAVSLFNNVSCVIGFPHGNSMPDTKCHEALYAMINGAKELDVVVNYGRFLDGDSEPMELELQEIVREAKYHNVLVKAILETCYYSRLQIREACYICADTEVGFVKTSTGYASNGATEWAVQEIIDAVCLTPLRVKASGGIKTYKDAARMLDLGCDRIGSGSFHSLLPTETNHE